MYQMLHQAYPPSIIAVVGTTGSMKSELALQLAKRLGGHIINSDALQVYSGLNILTNKVSLADQLSVPHHLLNLVSITSPSYSVRCFDEDAKAIINSLYGQNRPAVVVGGTHYYLQYLLWGSEDASTTPSVPNAFVPDLNHLDSKAMYAKLQVVDPVAAAQWHPNDTRRVRRALERFFARNCTPTKPNSVPAISKLRFPVMVLWTHADPEILNSRLDARVNAMVDLGLFQELWTVWQAYTRVPISMRDKGAFQAIGFKEFEAYLCAVDQLITTAEISVDDLFHLISQSGIQITQQEPDPILNSLKQYLLKMKSCKDNSFNDFVKLDQMRIAGLEAMKLATRRYARRQISWIRSRLLPKLGSSSNQNTPALFYKIDTSNILSRESLSNEIVDVIEPIALQFLSENQFKSRELSMFHPLRNGYTSASNKIVQLDLTALKDCNKRTSADLECQECERKFMNEHEWKAHQNSRTHRQLIKKKRKKLVELISCLGNIGNN